MKMRTLFSALLILAFAGICLGQTEPASKAQKVPFDLLSTQHMVVKVKINGKGPYRLIFDTGAPVTLINNKLAKETGVITKNTKKPLFSPFGSVGQFKINDLEIGEVKAKNLPTMVMDHPTVTLMSKLLGPIEGIVGMSFFGRYRMTIDYQAKEMTFSPGNFEPPDLMNRMMTMMMAPKGKGQKEFVSPAALWGFSVVKEKGDEDSGVIINEVLPKIPAAKAGMKKGDRLLVLDDRWTDTVLDCYQAASQVRPGSSAQATIRRDGKDEKITIQVLPGL